MGHHPNPCPTSSDRVAWRTGNSRRAANTRRPKNELRLILASLSVSLASLALAWNGTAHAISAEMALQDLTPRTRQRVEALLKVGVDPSWHDIRIASTWADAHRTERNGPWHYINFFFRKDGKPVQNKPLEENVVWAIDKFSAQIADPKLPQAERAQALRYLIHFVGDVHQPLHATALESEQFPTGDRGGNDYRILAPRGFPSNVTNLHRLWDLGCGAFLVPNRPGEEGWEEDVAVRRAEIEKMFPRAKLASYLRVHSAEMWARESFSSARHFVYTTPMNQEPSVAYLRRGREISQRRLALSAYRLADLLNRKLDPPPAARRAAPPRTPPAAPRQSGTSGSGPARSSTRPSGG